MADSGASAGLFPDNSNLSYLVPFFSNHIDIFLEG